MRIFLTGATGYVGAAVLDALVRGGHDVTALVRDNEKARARRQARRASGDRQPRGSRVVPRQRRGAGRLRPHGVRLARRAAGPAIERAALETLIAAAKRPRTAGATAPATALRHLHVGRLGARAGAGAGRRGRADQSDRARGVAARRTSSSCSTPASDHLRTIVVRPGVVYGGGNGMVGDIFKSATQRPGPRRRRRQQPLAAGLRPRPRRSLRAAGRQRRRVRRLPRERRRRRARQRHRRRDRAVSAGAARRAVRAD